MSRIVQYNKHHASLAIEELFLQPRQQTQEWLLTYLDVFVLIIMLVISLIAISDFGTEEEKINKIAELQNYSKQPTLKKTFAIEKSKNKIIPETPLEKKENFISNEPSAEHQKKSPTLSAQKSSPIIKEKPSVIEFYNKNEYKEIKPKQENQLSDDTLEKQLKKTVDQLGLTNSVDMKVSLGYAQLEIQDKILFGSSEAALLKAGETLLTKLIPLLAKSSGLIYIEGHTDNRPIKTRRYPSNWELGAARATSVLHFLASNKLESSRLRAITYGDTKPITDNSTKEGREKNRRVNLIIKVSDKID